MSVSKEVQEGESVDMLQDVLQNLQTQQGALQDVQKALTGDISEVRKGGTAATASVTELSKLSPKLRSLHTGLQAEITRVKNIISKATQGAANAQKRKEDEVVQKAAEEKDMRTYLDDLASIQELVTAAEDSADAVVMTAEPLIAEPPDEGDFLQNAMEEIEAAAADSQEKIAAARKEINAKLQGARKFAPDTRKAALGEYSGMQQKLSDTHKKIMPYRSFKKEFTNRVAARKSLMDITEKLSSAELEVEKAKMMTSAAEHGQMPENEVTAADRMIKPVGDSIEYILTRVNSKLRGAEGAVKEELLAVKEKATATKKGLEGVISVLRRQRESITVKEMLAAASGKVDKAEECFGQCSDAELPFLKGIEVLPTGESAEAIKGCSDASRDTERAVSAAKRFIDESMAEAKKYVKELETSTMEELKAHQLRLDGIATKLSVFKKETHERKLAALMAEVVESVMKSEKTLEVLTKAAAVFSTEALEEVTTDALKEAVEQSVAAEKETSKAHSEARRVHATKSKDAKGADAIAALTKFQTRISNVGTELGKLRKIISTGEKLIKGKEVLSVEGEKITKVEEDAKRCERKVKPGEEEMALGIEASKPSDEEIEELGTTLDAAQKILKASTRVVEANLAGAPASLKASLQKLADRCKAAQTKITEVLSLTKEQRERVMAEASVRQAKEKIDAMDKGIEKVNEAELPFLKGLEVLPLSEAKETIKASEDAAKEVTDAVSGLRTFIAEKNLEIKTFGEAASKPAIEELATLTEKINAAASKIGQFKKDTETRKKTAVVQEAGEKVTAFEAEMKTMAEVAEPFTKKKEEVKEGEEKKEEPEAELSEAEIEKLVGQYTTTKKAQDDARRFLEKVIREMKGITTHAEKLKDLQTRFTDAQKEMGSHKKVASKHEQKFVAKKLLSDANERLATMEADISKTNEFCAALTEQGGEKFLVATSCRTLAGVLREHMEAKELTRDALFKGISGGADSASREAFASWLEKLPEAITRDEVAFVVERREAMFKHISEGGESVSLAQFEAIFKERYSCVKEVTVTDIFEVAKSKSVAKLKEGELLETDKGAKKSETGGLLRLEVTIVETGATGFVTMQGNQGTKFIDLISPFSLYCEDMDKKIEDTNKGVSKVSSFLGSKMKELSSASRESPLAEACSELKKLRSKVSKAQDEMQKLKVKADKGKLDFSKKEAKEKNAHIEARERKEAMALLAPAGDKVDALETALKALEDVAKPITSLSGPELGAFATPVAIADETSKLSQALMKAVEEAKAAVKEQQEEYAKVGTKYTKGPMFDAKRDLQKMASKADIIKTKAKKFNGDVKRKCQAIVEIRRLEVAGLLRNEVQKRDTTAEKFFLDLVKPGDDKISEESFTSYVRGLMGDTFNAEHVKLLCRHIDTDGIGRRRFQAFVQQYYVVVKSIAITNVFEIKDAKTIRKAELEEVIEVMEGPRKDEKLGVERVRGKSLVDGAEGWISLKGNQGTPFLEEVEKPYYSCKLDVNLENEFKVEGDAGLVRTLGADEVIELIQGPKKIEFEPGLRVRGKATSDDAAGWFTARDKTGAIFAEQDSKYYVCTASVAFTDGFDIKNCKVLRKLAVGELFTVEEGPIEEETASITRVKGKALKDNVVGWITLKGNAGTVFGEASTKHWCILKEVPLTKKAASATPGDEVRVLAKGEAMHVAEQKKEAFAPEVRIRGKSLSDGAEGWLTLKPENLKPWTPLYKCKAAAPVFETSALEAAKEIRQAAVGESFELLEGPVIEGKALRMKAKAAKDGIVGWVSIKDSEGKRFFEA